MIYFGAKGRLIGVRCPSAQRVADDDRYQFSTTLEGKRKAQVVPGDDRRVWDLTLGNTTTPDQVSVLRDIARGAWGYGPFSFVPAEGPDTNMLSPGVASCDPVAGLSPVNEPGGPMLTSDGWAARSLARVDPPGYVHFGSEGITGASPVRPGQTVTASAYVEGDGAAAQVAWWDAEGAFISSGTSSVTAPGLSVVRSHVTATAPAGAVWASVRAVNAVRATRPALSWGDRLLPFADGRLAQKVVVDQVSSDLVHTLPGRTYQNLTFTVTEVG
jgi:hypothetical protein